MMSRRYSAFPREALEQSIPARFSSRVAEDPERLAVKSDGESFSYGALDRLSNGIAHAILGVAGATLAPVVLLLGQGVPLIAAIIGTLKAGKVYVPLDPSFPPAHLVQQLRNSEAGVVLTSFSVRPLVKALQLEHLQVLEIETLDMRSADTDPGLAISPDAGAYVYYTSGSTGRPKGVLDSHRNVLHNIMRYTNTLRIGPDDRLTLLQGPSFSGAVSSLFGALLNGASIFPFDVPREGADRIAPWLAREQITIYHSVPALFRRVAESGVPLTTLRLVRLEGDQASPRDVELFQRHLPRGAVLVNGLGATECGIVRQFFVDHDSAVPEGVVPIGYPVEDVEIAVVNQDGVAVPVGEVGDITVTSRYLALGYWHEPELTTAAFHAEPGADGVRTYRTGDLGRLRSDGCLEHLGRKDFQLKIAGNRVEAAEVETALLEIPGVKEVMVATQQGTAGEPRLVAYIVPTVLPGPTVSAVRRRLAGRLPSFMIPTSYVILDALPLNSNAKVDRRALPVPTADRPFLGVPTARPENLLQQQLVGVWEAVLGVRPVGIRDDFFDLGGSSLLALRMADEVERLLGRRISRSAMLAASTVEDLADAIQSENVQQLTAPVVPVQRDGSRPPFFFLHGDYFTGGFYCAEFARRLGPDQPFYALPPYGLDAERIPESYEAMAERHVEALRAVRPKGPYRLGGTCNGGLVALEMARRLIDDGERVDRLILVSASVMNVRWRLSPNLIRVVGWWMRRGSSERFDRFLDLAYYWDSLNTSARARLVLRSIGKIGKVRQVLGAQSSALSSSTSGLAAARRKTFETYRRIDKDYTPAPYRGNVIVLWPADDRERLHAARWWRAVTRDVDFRIIPGSHVTSLTVHVDALASAVRRCLDVD